MPKNKWSNFNRARARRPRGSMTGPERAYQLLLELRRAAGEITWWRFKPGTLRLATSVRYEPDFAYVDASTHELVYVEVKGSAGWSSDHSGKSRTKWSTAGDLFPWARFEVAILKRPRTSSWQVEVYEPAVGAPADQATPT